MGERSFAGTVRAPEFRTGLDWLNVERPLTLADARGRLVEVSMGPVETSRALIEQAWAWVDAGSSRIGTR